LWGTAIHDYLSQIYTREDVKKVSESIQKDKKWDKNSKNMLLQMLKNVFSHPQAEVLFGKDALVKNEAEIIDENGKSYRIDRLILNGNNCVLIDYKTGKPQDKHVEQINLYGDLLEKAGFYVEEKRIVYIDAFPNP